MSSSINPQNINGNYPVAGQDNDSQGFRDNFTNIKNNLSFAKTELEDLQNKAILRLALTGGSTPENNMNGTLLVGPQLKNATETSNSLVAVGGSLLLDYSTGHLHHTTIDAISGSVVLAFLNWPATSFGYGKVRLRVDVADVTYTLTLPGTVSIGYSDIQGISGNTVSFTSTGTYLFEFSSYDGGTTIIMQDLLRNYKTSFSNISSFASITISGNADVGGNIRTGNITTVAGTNNSLYIDPDGSGSVIFGTSTPVFIQNAASASNVATSSLRVTGGIGSGSNIHIASNKQLLVGIDLNNIAFLPQATAQLFSNIAGYSQINQQNINAGTGSSSDLVLTADNGNDVQGFIDVGINSSTYTQTGFTIANANDAYVYVVGNATTGGGNLTIGTGLSNNDIVFFTGGTLSANEMARFSQANGNLAIKTTTKSTSVNTGALTVAGGVGIAGNLSTGGARIEAGYQYSAPVTGFNTTITSNVSRVIFDPAGTLANGTVTLPSANVDATIISISSTQTITAFQVLPNTGTTLMPSGNITLTSGSCATYFFHASESKWYKIA